LLLLTLGGLVAIVLAGCGDGVKTRVDDTPPEADLVARPSCGPVPLDVTLDASASEDEESRIIGYAWDVNGDDVYDTLTVDPQISLVYADIGTVYVRVRVTNRDSLSSTADASVWAFDEQTDPSFCAYPNQRTQRVRGIEYTLGLDRTTFTRGDTLRFFYRIRNLKTATAEFPIHWTCHIDYHVYAGACSTLNAVGCSKKWQYTDGVVCVNHPSQITVDPDGNEQFTQTWVPRFTLSPGDYTAFARVYHGPVNPTDSTVAWVQFEVE
jgi:hypothetical protein